MVLVTFALTKVTRYKGEKRKQKRTNNENPSKTVWKPEPPSKTSVIHTLYS